MIRMPDIVKAESFEEARTQAMAKKKELVVISSIQYEYLYGGVCVQMLHSRALSDRTGDLGTNRALFS